MSRQAWLPSLLLAGLLVLLQMGGHDLQAALRFSRPAMEQGEWWRLVTAHFVHLGWVHTVLNAAGLLLCCALAPSLFTRYVWLKTVILALGVGILLWFFSPEIDSYSGFSGVLYGLLWLGLWPQARCRDRLSALALIMTAGWMLWQSLVGPLVSEEMLIGGPIAGAAHVYGFCTGIAVYCAGMGWQRIRSFHGNIKT